MTYKLHELRHYFASGLIALGFKRYGFAREVGQIARDISLLAHHFMHEPVRVEVGKLTRLYVAALAEQPGRVEPARFAMVLVHMGDDVRLRFDQAGGAGRDHQDRRDPCQDEIFRTRKLQRLQLMHLFRGVV